MSQSRTPRTLAARLIHAISSFRNARSKPKPICRAFAALRPPGLILRRLAGLRVRMWMDSCVNMEAGRYGGGLAMLSYAPCSLFVSL
jgi:hypothetical protein